MIMQLNQKATYWYPDGPGSWGVPDWSDPVVLDVRWQDKQQLIRSKEGKEIVSDAVVYTVISINPEGRLQKGIVTGDPGEEAREPQSVSQHVTVSGQTDHWKVFL